MALTPNQRPEFSFSFRSEGSGPASDESTRLQQTPLADPTSGQDNTMPMITGKKTKCSCLGPPGKNLVVCIDGTSNQFSKENSNVVELYSRLVKDSNQLTYYNSGIGTYVKYSEGWRSWLSPVSLYQRFIHGIDMATAWTLKSKVLSAYLWLSENYEDGDRIFLFGFSRGAYQVRVIAGMLELVGLLYKGNNEQIPFAYELYTKSISDDKRSASDQQKKKPLCAHFKKTLSQPNAKAHFVGTWDTVSSVGIFRERRLPETITGMKHVCSFRQALALDELRVKFLPEFANGGAAPSGEHIKEVWFAGSHSDIFLDKEGRSGGGNVANEDSNLFGPSLRWMSYEAISCGLRMIHHEGEWSRIPLNNSMNWFWWLFEYSPFPIPRLSYESTDGIERWIPHRKRPRKIHDGQLIHQSALEEIEITQAKGYRPQPQCPFKGGWDKIPSDWERMEKDPYSQAGEALAQISQVDFAVEDGASNEHIHVLGTLASQEVGRRSIISSPAALDILITSIWLECDGASKQHPPSQIIFNTLMSALTAFEMSSVGVRRYIRRLLEMLSHSLAERFPIGVRELRAERLQKVMTDLRLPHLFAITIGIDNYLYPGIKSLRGAVADADAVADYLRTNFIVSSSQIINLRNEGATRERILAAFRSLENDGRIQKNDPILIYYAGHGAAVPGGHLRSETTEVIIPQDYTPDSVFPIPDRTLAALLNRLCSVFGNNITVIFDCGFVSPDGVQNVYGARSPHIAVNPGPYDLDREILDGGNTPKGHSHTILQACAAYEVAQEYPENGNEDKIRGIFTAALLQVLERAGPEDITYSHLLAQMPFFPCQTTQIVGSRTNRTVFDFNPPSYSRLFHNVTYENEVYTLEAGTAHGITMDSYFALYMRTEAVLGQTPLTVATPVEISHLTTTLKPRGISPLGQVPPAMIAVQTYKIPEMHFKNAPTGRFGPTR